MTDETSLRGAATINEMRAKHGLPPRPDGDVYMAAPGAPSKEDLLAPVMAENAQLHRRVEHYTALSASLGALVRELEAKVIDKDREIETLRRTTVRAVWTAKEGGAA